MIPLLIKAWNARHAIVKYEFLLETIRLDYWQSSLGYITFASYQEVTTTARDRFRERGALGHLSFWGPRKCDLFGRLSGKRERMPLLCVCAPSKVYILWFRLWFYDCLRSQHKLKTIGWHRAVRKTVGLTPKKIQMGHF